MMGWIEARDVCKVTIHKGCVRRNTECCLIFCTMGFIGANKVIAGCHSIYISFLTTALKAAIFAYYSYLLPLKVPDKLQSV